jgi:polyhydroxyalkanoate synthesis regulator protein
MPRLVKRYARSRLYDTEAVRYVTLADLKEWPARGQHLPLSTPKQAKT